MMVMLTMMIFVVDVLIDMDEDDALMMGDVDDDFDDVHAMDVSHWLNFVNSNTYVEMDEDWVVRARI